MQVRERIRINGQPLSKELFSKYFWLVYRRLWDTKVGCGVSQGSLRCGEPPQPPPDAPIPQDEAQANMPAYFRFLTIMAFHVFLQEKVGGVMLGRAAWRWWGQCPHGGVVPSDGVCRDGLESDLGI